MNSKVDVLSVSSLLESFNCWHLEHQLVTTLLWLDYLVQKILSFWKPWAMMFQSSFSVNPGLDGNQLLRLKHLLTLTQGISGD